MSLSRAYDLGRVSGGFAQVSLDIVFWIIFLTLSIFFTTPPFNILFLSKLGFMLVPIFPFIKLSHSRYPAREVWHLYLGLQVFFFCSSFYIWIVGNWALLFFFYLLSIRLAWPHDLAHEFAMLTQVNSDLFFVNFFFDFFFNIGLSWNLALLFFFFWQTFFFFKSLLSLFSF
jgi:hypothetical protein